MKWELKNRLILIGYMGCGKSTIGREMAKVLEGSFLDTDAWIEEKEGMTISKIFEIKGEAYFRDLETACLKALVEEKRKEDLNKKEVIISVGGGLPVREENQLLLKELGRVIYLKAKPDTIYERVKTDTTRPLLQTENPLQKIKDMLAVREGKYQAAAHEVIHVDGKGVEKIIEEILENENSI